MSDIAPHRIVPFSHGTYTGYTNHKCRCDDCKAASAEYMREYRATNKRYRRGTRARGRALFALAAAHPDEFAELFNNERAKEGLPPVGTDGRGPAKYIEDES